MTFLYTLKIGSSMLNYFFANNVKYTLPRYEIL